MTTDKLSLFNGMLRVLGERKLSSLTENREPRRVLDDIWDTGLRDQVLSSGLWNFATRTIRIEYDPSIEPDFGYQRAFEKPDDWIRTAAISGDEYFNSPLDLDGYADEQNYWLCDYDTIYIRYISKDENYGYDLSKWPINFVRYVEGEGAFQGAERITQSGTKEKKAMDVRDMWLGKAKSTDAMNEGAQFLPQGSWSRARKGSSSLTRRPGGWERG